MSFYLGWVPIGLSCRGHIHDFLTGEDNAKGFRIQDVRVDSKNIMGLK